MAKNYWLMKTEEDVFSFEDLMRSPKKTTYWEGVRNYQARNFMRDDFKVGDGVLFYHSRSDNPGVYGVAEVVRSGYPDATAMDSKSKYKDSKAIQKKENPWIRVDIKAKHGLKKPVLLKEIKADPIFKEMLVIRKGMRLSIQPVTKVDFENIVKCGGKTNL